jgi:hypothetical protein
MITRQTVVNLIRIFYGSSDPSLRQDFGVFVDQPFLEGHQNRISQAFPHFCPFVIRQIPVISLPFHFIKQAYLLQGIFRSVFIFLQGFFKLPPGMCPATKG